MQKRSPAFVAEQRDKPYSILMWGSHPDDDNDDCSTGVDFDTREEAELIFRSADPIEELSKVHRRDYPDGINFAAYYRDTPFIELDGPDINEVRKLGDPRKIPVDDHEWRREQAMQAGMGLGVDAYNDAMGYGTETPDESED